MVTGGELAVTRGAMLIIGPRSPVQLTGNLGR